MQDKGTVLTMELNHGNIRVAQILQNPKAKQIFVREFPDLARSPLLAMAANMTLSQVLSLAKGRVDDGKVQRLLEQLREL